MDETNFFACFLHKRQFYRQTQSSGCGVRFQCHKQFAVHGVEAACHDISWRRCAYRGLASPDSKFQCDTDITRTHSCLVISARICVHFKKVQKRFGGMEFFT